MIARRDFIIAFSVGAVAGPLAVFSQQPAKVWRVGFLAERHIGALDKDFYGAFATGMHELGYVEGKNLVIEWRSSEGENSRLPAIAAELVHLKVDVIVVSGSKAAAAAQRATTTIPVVMGAAGDPVGTGFVKSLARPGGNITGVSNTTPDYSAKYVEMLREVVPGLSRLAYLLNPDNPSQRSVANRVQAASERAGIAFFAVEARSAREIEGAFATLRKKKAGAVVVGSDSLFTEQAGQIAELAIRGRLASVGQSAAYPVAGGLMSYGRNRADSFRRAAYYVDKILKGANPADLPVEQAMTIELVINRKTARALGIAIPQAILLRADKVIE